MMTNLRHRDQGSGLPIVWIHGFPLSSLIFEQQLQIPDVRHLAPDLPGFGESNPSPLESIDAFADSLLSFLDSKGIDKAVLAGVSMGGYVLFSMLRSRPDLARAILLIDTREGPDSEDARANRFAQIDRVASVGSGFLVEEMIGKMLTSDTIEKNDRRAEIVRQSMQAASPVGITSALRAMAGRPDSTDVLQSFDGPVLVVVGERDAITPPSDARRMASLSSRSRVVEIPEAAHLSNVERPERFNAAVRELVESLR